MDETSATSFSPALPTLQTFQTRLLLATFFFLFYTIMPETILGIGKGEKKFSR